MDPTANLREQLEIAARLTADESPYRSITERIADSDRLAELVLALDEWIGKGGFYPGPWQRPERAPETRRIDDDRFVRGMPGHSDNDMGM